ncbi:MAG: lytic transglycosylase domain-containing protein, partial [Bradyrhizobium sp.]|nr:lytic transglycosylase domain-containing protein [Bradyrhizobium sp.]
TPPQPTDPIFRSLFQAGDRAQPVSPAVQELWGNSSSLTSGASATSVASVTSASSTNAAQSLSGRKPEVRPPGRLDLFSDRLGTFS